MTGRTIQSWEHAARRAETMGYSSVVCVVGVDVPIIVPRRSEFQSTNRAAASRRTSTAKPIAQASGRARVHFQLPTVGGAAGAGVTFGVTGAGGAGGAGGGSAAG